MTGARARGLLGLTLAVALPGLAHAQTTTSSPAIAAPAPQDALRWRDDWPRFRAEEVGLTLGLAAGLTATTLLIPTPPDGFSSGWVIDEPLRDLLRASDEGARGRISDASDVIQNITLLVPILVDLGIGALWLGEDLDVALQMALIDAEAFVLTASLVMLTKRSVGRVRPNVLECPDGGYACRSNASRRAFLSGHASAAFTAAGLSCVHHQHLRLFGGLGDDLMCAGMLAMATTTSVLRVASDKHWTTDILFGAVTGLASGYAMPYLLHYGGAAQWPGLGDGALDGSIALHGLAGATWLDRAPAAIGGVQLSGRILWSMTNALRLEGAMQGRLLYDSRFYALRSVRPELRLWLGPIGVGGTMIYASHESGARNVIETSFGPTLSVGLLDEAHPVTLSLMWMPGAAGDARSLTGRLRASPWRYVDVLLEVTPVRAEGEGERFVGAMVLAGVGGRLGW